jgi:hypothetical protein
MVSVRDERLCEVFQAVYAEPDDTTDPGEMDMSRWIRAWYTMIALDRVYCGAPVHPDTAETLLLRPISEIRADLAGLVRMTPDECETAEDIDKVSTWIADDAAWKAEKAAWVADMDRRHAHMIRAINLNFLEVGRGLDLARCDPELASQITAAMVRLENLVNEALPTTGEAGPVEAEANNVRALGTPA